MALRATLAVIAVSIYCSLQPYQMNMMQIRGNKFDTLQVCQIEEDALSSGVLLSQVNNVSHHSNTIKVTKNERQKRATP